jgi:Protein of unknown function (DUF2840)
LLHLSGWPKVEKVLRAIDIVEELGIDSANAAPAHWRHVQNRLFVNENLGNTRSPDIGLGFSAGTSTGDPRPGKADHDGERDGCPPDMIRQPRRRKTGKSLAIDKPAKARIGVANARKLTFPVMVATVPAYGTSG